MTVLFISDLHLQADRPDITKALFRFLEQTAPGAEALYILGDFFEYWIGDDYHDGLIDEVRFRLHTLSSQGVPIFFMHGNRDFLLGEEFAASAGMLLVHDPSVIELHGQRALLMHGDSLCTADAEYQAFRAQARNPEWQQAILSKSSDERLALARQLREKSKTESAMKAEDIMDVTQSEVERVMREHDVRLLIHGHTHRPAVHEFELDGAPAKRIVLGDWHEQIWSLTSEAGTLRLEPGPL